ncbi:E3 ubiquitin-protein ligase HUWE1-like isoform X2 [Babylonia areolata]|uniref:E3 ubiquitin-protein ligase HUWE1-like isoform X2 n=1 Tax=Babylonia areolata TaxID=304850 RepID=UPI003FD244AB
MKIDRSKLKKSSSEVPADCKTLIERIKSCPESDLLQVLSDVKSWTYGKCELYHWADVLDQFDAVLEKGCAHPTNSTWTMACDLPEHEQLKLLLLEVVRFTALLIEHSFSRHLYSSMEHLISLLASCDMLVVLAVLNLLYVFSKRSNFITRMNPEKRQALIIRLTHLAESWGGKENGFGLAECCKDLPTTSYPASATTLHFEFYVEHKDEKSSKKSSNAVQSIHMENLDRSEKLPTQIMEELMENFSVPSNKQVLLYTHIRLAHLFPCYSARIQCVQARLQAISILVYANAIQDNLNVILYPGLIEELVDIIEIPDNSLVEIKSAALRTLTSIIHIDRNPKLVNIIDSTGAASYHGFLPVLVRTCIQHMIDQELEPFPQQYATALFSFLYHLASYENGVEALVACGMMEALLKVINWYSEGQEHITFVTRAVRVIDLITNMDMAAFQAHGGLQAFINRLEHEVNLCRREQPFVVRPQNRVQSVDSNPESPPAPVEMETNQSGERSTAEAVPTTSSSTSNAGSSVDCEEPRTGVQCFPQRAALLKSMLNFLKKAIPDNAFTESIRHLMDGSLPRSLKHIISNAEYYGPSLFLLATDVVTVYVFQEPSLLSSLQDKGLTDVVLHALLIKDVPATREVLASLPNVFSALCLNARGLEAFVACRPFDRLFKVLLSPDYLPAMRRRRSADPFGDTASNLGNAMDELMRHQPSLRTDATKAIIKLLEEICSMGQDPKYICQKQQPKTEQSTTSPRSPQPVDGGSSEEEEEEEDLPAASSSNQAASSAGAAAAPAAAATPAPAVSSASAKSASQESMQSKASHDRQSIPLMEYVLNVMKFVEAILSNNSTDDHCREFVTQKGLLPLMGILGLPNLPIDFPASPACQAVASVCKSILSLSREPQVMKQGLLHLNEVLQKLEPLHRPLGDPGGSVLLQELAAASCQPDATLSPQATPLLHALAAAHAYITMFVHVCRMGQNDIRTISVSHWGSELGLTVLQGLSQLYTSLVWESTVLLALCSDDILPPGCQFGRADMDRIIPQDVREAHLKETVAGGGEGSSQKDKEEEGGPHSNGMSAAMESLTTSETVDSPMEVSASVDAPSTSAGVSGSGVNGSAAGTTTVGAGDRDSTPGPSDVDRDAAATASTTSESTTTPGGLTGKKAKVSCVLQAQIRQLKPLLSVSSRLGRALAELFGLLVKLCVGSPVRQRRSQQQTNQGGSPSPAARAVASALTRLLANGLSWEPPHYAPVPKLRLTFLVCSVGFTAPMLFDEKKQPFHLMLQKFVSCGGQSALFQAFFWALSMDGKVPLEQGLEHPELPEGSGEFLDSWLMLVEKMVNPKTVLESPHSVPKPKPPIQPVHFFNPTHYLIATQKAAFHAVMNLWNKKPLKVYGSRMCESLLAILSHIIRGEGIIKEQLAKEMEEEAASSSEPGPSEGASTSRRSDRRALENEVSPQHLQQLMDMGFTRAHAMDALMNTTTLEQATDYILSHPPPAFVDNDPSRVLGMEVDLTDEEQMMRAIALSLGESVVMSTDQADQSASEKKEEEEEQEKQEKEDPLDKSVLDDFTEGMLDGCLNLLDMLPETVYRVCDLLTVVTQRNGSQWRDKTLATIVEEVRMCCEHMLNITTNHCELSSQEVAQKLTSSEQALKFGVRLHLLSLLLEDMNVPCAEAIQKGSLVQLLVTVLHSTHHTLAITPSCSTPKWMAPLLLLLDLFEKIAVISQRKAQATILRAGSSLWKWFDDSTGRWCKYSIGNNKAIHDAYMAGESSVRFQAGRRKYCVQFTNMVQLNEETGNRRPVMLSIPTADEKAAAAREEREKAAAAPATCTVEALSALAAGGSKESTPGPSGKLEEGKMETEAAPVEDSMADTAVTLVGLSEDQISTIIRSLVSLISIPVESETLHALLRLVLRLTREHSHAVLFAHLGGPRMLLNLTQSVSFPGFLSLVTLLFRHVLDEPVALRNCMEKVMRSACSGIGSSASGVGNGSVGSKEMHYVMRVLGPAACRCPKFFVNVARDSLQIALPPQAKIQRDEDESRFTGPATPQLLKCSSLKMVDLAMDSSVKEFLCDLLNALVVKHACKQEEAQTSEVQPPQTLVEAIQDAVADAARTISEQSAALSVQNSTSDIPAEEDNASQSESAANQESVDKESKDKQPVDDKKARPLFPKSAILRLLSEVIKSYGNCTQLITQYAYEASQSDLLGEACSLLAFVLDQLLPQCQTAGDKDCPALARVFLASIASCNHCPEAQTTLVSEVKAALQRALGLPESAEKHSRVQALVGIISTIMEACPTPSGSISNSMFKNQQAQGNVMVKLLIRKGLVIDLARVPHSLDLSSPYMAATVNAALKPLETLSRAHNMPGQLMKTKAGGDSTAPFVQEDQGGTTHPATSSETTMRNLMQEEEVGQGEDNLAIQDVTDNPAAQADLDNTHQHSIVEPDPDSLNSDTELDQIVQQIFQGESRSGGGVLADYTMVTEQAPGQEESQDVMIDVMAAEGDDEMEQDNSQLHNQEASDGEDDGLHHHSHRADPNLDESPDSPSEGEDEDDFHELEQEEDGDDDDDDDEDDEGDEDEEGSDMEGDDDDYQEMDNSAALNQDDDFLLQLEDMQAAGGGGGHIIFSDNAQVCSYQLPVSLHDSDNANEASVPTLPPAPSGVTAAHPLLVRQSENLMNVRVPRSRHRASYRFTPSTHTFHVNMHSSGSSSRPNPPVILQRLLGPNATADILQLTHNIPQASVPLRTHLLANEDLRIISRPDEDLFEELFQDQYADAVSGGSGVLSSIPSTLTRWTEEARVLDGDSVHDCTTVVKPEVVDCLVKKRDAELAEWREKRKKAAAENSAKEKSKETTNEAAVASATTTTTATSSGMASSSPMESSISSCPAGTTTTVADVSAAQPEGQHPASITASSVPDTGGEEQSSVERLARSLVSEALQAGPSSTMMFTSTTTPAATAAFSLMSTALSTPTTALSTTATSALPSSPPTMLTVRRELNPAVSADNSSGTASGLGMGAAATPLSTSSPAPSSLQESHPMSSPLLTSDPTWSESPFGVSAPGAVAPPSAGVMPPSTVVPPASGMFAPPPTSMVALSGMAPPTSSALQTPMMSQLLERDEQEVHTILVPHRFPPRPWMQHPIGGARWFPSQDPSVMQHPSPNPSPVLPPHPTVAPRLAPQTSMTPQQLSMAQQVQPQQAMDTSTTGSTGHPAAYTPAVPTMYSSGNAPAVPYRSGNVPPTSYTSPQPILNLQEFLSGLAPSEDSPPFMFPFGGSGPLGRETSLDDPFLATNIPGIGNMSSQEAAQDPSQSGTIPSSSSPEGLSIAPEPTPVLSGLDLSSIVVSQSTSAPAPTPSSSGSSADPSPTTTTTTLTTSATITTTITTTTATSTSATTGPQEGASGSGASTSRTPLTMFGEELPEGVDPSFLAALPENIRQEVIADQLRLQRIQQRAQQQQQQSAETPGAMEVNPEFLAALPPNIQEEVLAQQRAEQARIQAQQRGGAEDNYSFIDTLSPQLRQSVLCDLDDNSISALPEHVAAEARELRQELEDRHRRIMQERLFQGGAASLSAILRNPSLYGRLGTRYAIRATGVPTLPRSRWTFGLSGQNRGSSNSSGLPVARLRGRHLLDHEALTCLLVLLFMDEPKLNTNRLCRVLRNLCYHAPTRTWILRALLSILQRTSECHPDMDDPTMPRISQSGSVVVTSLEKGSKGRKGHQQPAVVASPLDPICSSGSGWSRGENMRGPGSWLSISLEAALGCRANVFQVQRVSVGKKSCVSTPQGSSVNIHPQAAPVVCRHVLDTLISLAKVFPSHFLPTPKVREAPSCEPRDDRDADQGSTTPSVPPSGGARPKTHTAASGAVSPRLARSDRSAAASTTSDPGRQESDFWSLLLKLDGAGQSRRGKGVQKAHSGLGNTQTEAEALGSDYKTSALGQLMAMLSHPVVRRSQLLTDRLLRLLGLIAVGVQDNASLNTLASSTTTSTTTTTVTTSTATTTPAAVTAVSSVTPAVCLSVAPDVAAAASTPSSDTTPTTTTIIPGSESTVPPTENKPSEDMKEQEESGSGDEEPILMKELKMAVQVLTSKACSEEGLDDATSLLLQLSWANNATRHTILALLLEGARTLGLTVRQHICSLLEELRNLNAQHLDDSEDSRDGETSSAQQVKGVVADRFTGGGSVVVSAPSKIKSGRELQLPSMSQLTNKTSSQHFFLRILKVIIQLRDAARSASKRKSGRGSAQELASIIDMAMGELESEAEGLMELVRQRPSSRRLLRQSNDALAALGLRPALESGENVEGANAAPASGGDQEERGAGGSGAGQGADAPTDTPMEVDQPGPSSDKDKKEEQAQLPRLSEQLNLDELWSMLGDCLKELARTPDHHAVLILQPAVEAFFIVHAGEKESKRSDHSTPRREDQMAHLNVEMAPPSPSPGPSTASVETSTVSITRENSAASIAHLPPDTQKFLKFAETHRTVLNQILRQSTLPLADGPFSVLVDHTRMLDFDVKRRYFRQELERMEEGMRREDLPVHVRREHVFEDSFRELFRRTPEEWKQRFYIVFEGEEGQDAGGLLREWYLIISREIFNENYVLFKRYPRDGVTYTINPSSHFNSNHLSYFKFVGRIIAKAIYDNKLLECYFTRSFYKHVLGLHVKYTDMECEDIQFYQSLVFLLENDITDMGADLGDLNFSAEVEEFGVRETRDLIENGSNIAVTEENKREYVKLVCQMKMTGAIRQQLNAFLEGFYDIIPKKLVGIFTEQELELLISGLPTIDIDDLKANTEYHKYQPTSLQIQWFWRALRSFDQAERANFLQFVTGTSKVPLQGFATLEGMNGHQKFQIHRDDRSTDRLPSAHTCFNQLDLPAYETYDKLRKMLLLAVSECSEGFGLA